MKKTLFNYLTLIVYVGVFFPIWIFCWWPWAIAWSIVWSLLAVVLFILIEAHMYDTEANDLTIDNQLPTL